MTRQEISTQRAVTDLIETYRQGFLHLDPQRLGSIWDREHVPLIYVAMERPEPIEGWPAIEDYFAALPQHLEQMVEKNIGPIKVDAFGDAAAAYFEFHSVVRLKGGAGLYRPTGRVTMLFKRTQTEWRAIHYHESALAAQAAEQINRMKAFARAREHSDRTSEPINAGR